MQDPTDHVKGSQIHALMDKRRLASCFRIEAMVSSCPLSIKRDGRHRFAGTFKVRK